MELLIATSNTHKLQELRKILPKSFTIHGLSDIGFTDEIPETGATFSENALQKAWYLHNRVHKNCIADDSGLEVMALNGRPGVFSARYAGINADNKANVEKLLSEMKGILQRKAVFKTVLALILNEESFLFEGTVEGRITTEPRGKGGFGYDPVFIPDGYDISFAEMTPQEKNSISHRAMAGTRLVEFLLSREKEVKDL